MTFASVNGLGQCQEAEIVRTDLDFIRNMLLFNDCEPLLNNDCNSLNICISSDLGY